MLTEKRFRRIFIFALLSAILALVLGYFGYRGLRSIEPEQREAATEENGTAAPVKDADLGMHDAPPLEEINQTLRLFQFEGDFRDARDSRSLWLVRIGAAFAYVSVLSGVLLVIFVLLHRTSREMRLMGVFGLRTHAYAVIFNLPDKLRSLLPEFAKCHQRFLWSSSPVVVVLEDLGSPLAKACERHGLWVIEATPLDDDLFLRSGAKHACQTYIFGEDSAANLDLALRCQKEVGAKCDNPEIHVEIEDPDVRYAMLPHSLEEAASAAIVPFSLTVNAARQALRGGRLATLPGDTGSTGEPRLRPDVTYVLFGCSRWLRAFFAEIIKNSVIDLETRPGLHIVCPGAGDLERRLRVEIPEWEQLHAEITFHETKGGEPEDYLAASRTILPQVPPDPAPPAPWNFLCLLSDDGDNLSLATRLMAEMLAPGIPDFLRACSRVLYASRESTELGRVAATCAPKGGPSLEAVGSLEKVASLEAIRQADVLPLALAIHNGYSEISDKGLNLWSRATGRKAFVDLPLIKREQNFAQADHIDVKIDALGLLPVAGGAATAVDGPLAAHASPEEVRDRLNEILPDGWKIPNDIASTTSIDTHVSPNPESASEYDEFPKELRRLAELEHLRWMQVHTLGGYRHRPLEEDGERMDDARRCHDCICPFGHENFPRDTIRYDIETIRILPRLVRVLQRELRDRTQSSSRPGR